MGTVDRLCHCYDNLLCQDDDHNIFTNDWLTSLFLPSTHVYILKKPVENKWNPSVRLLPIMESCTHARKWLKQTLLSSALPDLVLDTDILKGHMEMNVIALKFLRCAMEENCLGRTAAIQLR